jgi:putative membrane protein
MVSLNTKRKYKWMGLRQIVLFIWTLTFSYLIWDDNYTLFIKPSFGFLIYSGLIISVLFAMGSFFDSHESPRSGTEILNALFILLPVIFIFSAGDKTLNSATLSKRTLVMPSLLGEASVPPPEAFDGLETDKEIETSLSELLRNWKRYSGKRVALDGLFYNAIENEKSNPMVFKYLISCCAADALPVAIFLENADISSFANDDWVKVAGVVNLKKRNGTHDAIYMTVNSIKKIPKPSKAAAYIFF